MRRIAEEGVGGRSHDAGNHRDVCQPSAMDDGIVYWPNRGRLLCCIKALISIKPYINTNRSGSIYNNSISKSIRQQQRKKTYHLEPCLHRFCVILFTNILWVSIRLKLISNIDDAIVYNTTGANAAEARGDADIY